MSWKAAPPAPPPPPPPAAGSGLLQFPKLTASERRKTDDADPFAVNTPKLPSFGQEPKPAEPKRPAAKPSEEKSDEVKLPEAKPKLADIKTPEPRPVARSSTPAAKTASPSDSEPPKTVIRRRVEPEPAKPSKADSGERRNGDSKPPRRGVERAESKPKPQETSSGAPARKIPLSWIGTAVMLVITGAAAAIFLNVRRDTGVASKSPAAPGSIFAKGSDTLKLDPAQVVPPAPPSVTPASVIAAATASLAPAPATPAPVSAPGLAALAVPIRAPSPALPPPPPPPPAPVAAPVAPASAPKRGPVVILLKKPEIPLSPEEVVAKAKPKAQQWVFEGRIYDLLHLNSVANARLALIGPKGEEVADAVTAPTGRYKISAEALPIGGYKLTLKHPDYTGAYLDDIDPPFSEAPREDRLQAAQGASSRPWTGVAGKTTTRNLVAVPKNTEE
jgi:hypothetical protein